MTSASADAKDALAKAIEPLTHSGSVPDRDPVRLLVKERHSLMLTFEKIENARWPYNPCCWNKERCETPWGKDIPIWYAHIPPDSLVHEWAGGDPAYGVFILCEKHHQALKAALEAEATKDQLAGLREKVGRIRKHQAIEKEIQGKVGMGYASGWVDACDRFLAEIDAAAETTAATGEKRVSSTREPA